MNSIRKVILEYGFLFCVLFCSIWVGPKLNAQGTGSAYTQPRFQKYLQMVQPDQSISYSFWVDQTTSCSIVVSTIVKNLGIQLKDPNGNLFLMGQPDSQPFQSSLSPDPMTYPDAPGANYYINLGTPSVGQWTLRIMTPTAPDPILTFLIQMAFNNQVGPVLIGGGRSGPVGNLFPFTLAVMDGLAKVGNLQINAMLYRLDDPATLPVPATFTDDGQGTDFAAIDLIYSAYVVPTQPGEYVLQVELSGDASTGHFQRSIASGFKVVAKTARIVGTFKERVIPAIPR